MAWRRCASARGKAWRPCSKAATPEESAAEIGAKIRGGCGLDGSRPPRSSSGSARGGVVLNSHLMSIKKRGKHRPCAAFGWTKTSLPGSLHTFFAIRSSEFHGVGGEPFRSILARSIAGGTEPGERPKMRRKFGWMRDPSFHLIALTTMLTWTFLSIQSGSLGRLLCGSRPHPPGCHACSSSPPGAVLARDHFLVETGCIEPSSLTD
jgi:hypothetical protein